MFNPVATYRIQFHKGFTFEAFEKIIPYLKKMGVSTIYAAPIFESVPGSMHGYDGVNPQRINPEIGTEEQLKKISKELKENGISWLQDIVPNHLAFHPNNRWLTDVLERGEQSAYASFFDVDWGSKLMVPFLGSSLEDAVRKGELKIDYQDQGFVLRYYDTYYPLNAASYTAVLQSETDGVPAEIQALVAGLPKTIPELKELLGGLMEQGAYVSACLERVNNDAELLQQIVDSQYYRLCHWQETDRQINYRRFFTVNGLICLQIQRPEVFDHYHTLTKALVDEGVFQGLRVDHIDGLFDPAKYLEQLRALAGMQTYIVVEKILEQGEQLPDKWPVQGNTGYDFLAQVNNLFTNKNEDERFERFYREVAGDTSTVQQQLSEKKAHILYEHMGGELENLYRLFKTSNVTEEDVPEEIMKEAIGAFLVQCPVYRYYGNALPLAAEEANAIQHILNGIKESRPELVAAIQVLEKAWLEKPKEGVKEYNDRAVYFYQRCMQFTGPLMAKGMEDTLMYTYNRFIGHNEVGDSPEMFGVGTALFHQLMQERQARWPLSINATATHDTKRGEDVRARLNVLTDMADEWLQQVEKWRELNAAFKTQEMPDANDEYFIYQTLTGACPMPGREDDFEQRIKEYLPKALREAKTHSNWTTPDEAYERACQHFVSQLFNKKGAFWKSFNQFQKRVVDFGIVNSLSQVLLKFTCPGLPDVYQGTELWDFSLVDPDNRRTVDYEHREELLDGADTLVDSKDAMLQKLWDGRYCGQIKLWLTQHLLHIRKQAPELFAAGDYIPLEVAGTYGAHIFAFARRHQQQWVVSIVPLHVATLCTQQKKEILSIDWKDTHVVLPPEAPVHWEQLPGLIKVASEDRIFIKEAFKNLPFAVLQSKQALKERAAGVLMPVTALPAPFGVGDLGPGARHFVDFLCRGRQKYWQLLPLNPTEAESGHSPYSSISSMAGNALLLSPELLVKDGLLAESELEAYRLPSGNAVDYDMACKVKPILWEQAYARFQSGGFEEMRQAFELFCQDEAYWLRDFALFVVLREQHDNKPWYEWAETYKKRDRQALDTFEREHSHALERTKWLQFIFMQQWKELKAYSNKLGVELFGDLPFYVSYDSVDVWSHPEIFCLDEDGNMMGVAGVPPDYFSATGQLWGMPTFRWDVLKEQHYDWWVCRLRKNLELFDLVRMDHFRALADYWQVPAGETTAKNGKWLKGPGTDFFEVLKRELNDLPFIAEDLGDDMNLVYELRDKVGLPGMKVLQFAFGDNQPQSVDVPHNYTPQCVAYTGTHDNNTTLGWYRNETKRADRKRIEAYAGHKINEKNINDVMARMAYASVAKIAVLPMQDVLKLDETARMNTPSSDKGNWLWRMRGEQLTTVIEKQLREWALFYNRA